METGNKDQNISDKILKEKNNKKEDSKPKWLKYTLRTAGAVALSATIAMSYLVYNFVTETIPNGLRTLGEFSERLDKKDSPTTLHSIEKSSDEIEFNNEPLDNFPPSAIIANTDRAPKNNNNIRTESPRSNKSEFNNKSEKNKEVTRALNIFKAEIANFRSETYSHTKNYKKHYDKHKSLKDMHDSYSKRWQNIKIEHNLDSYPDGTEASVMGFLIQIDTVNEIDYSLSETILTSGANLSTIRSIINEQSQLIENHKYVLETLENRNDESISKTESKQLEQEINAHIKGLQYDKETAYQRIKMHTEIFTMNYYPIINQLINDTLEITPSIIHSRIKAHKNENYDYYKDITTKNAPINPRSGAGAGTPNSPFSRI